MLKEWFNKIKNHRWFKIFVGLFIIRWIFRLGVIAYLFWLAT